MPESAVIEFSQLNCSTRQMCRLRASVRSYATTQALEMRRGALSAWPDRSEAVCRHEHRCRVEGGFSTPGKRRLSRRDDLASMTIGRIQRDRAPHGLWSPVMRPLRQFHPGGIS